MATTYLKLLSRLVADLKIGEQVDLELEVKHFFSGAALYANNSICASWSPVGLAFKLPENEVTRLIASGNARPLRYFAKGPVKKDYALFEDPESSEKPLWENYFLQAVDQARHSKVE
jgi:TfoX/Sxy family transcriptional regulator of competence genes